MPPVLLSSQLTVSTVTTPAPAFVEVVAQVPDDYSTPGSLRWVRIALDPATALDIGQRLLDAGHAAQVA